MNFSPSFFKTAAFCAFVAGGLWVALMILSFGFDMPIDFESAIVLIENPVAMVAAIATFISLFLFVVVFWGVAAMKMETATGRVTTGFIFGFAGFLLQLVGYGVFTVAWTQGVGALTEADLEAREILKTNLLAGHFDTVMGLSLISAVCWAVMLVLYGLATWHGTGRREKNVRLAFFALPTAIVLHLVGMTSGLDLLASLTIPLIAILMLATLFLAGAWLWKGKTA